MATARIALPTRTADRVLVPAAVVGIAAGATWVGRLGAPLPILAAAVALAVVVTTVVDPRIGLGALAFAMVLSPEIGGAVYVRADDVILAAVVLGWLARRAVRGEPLRDNPLLVPMALLAALGLASFLLAVAAGNVDPFTGRRVPLAISALHWLKRVEYFTIAFLVAQVLRSRAEVALFAALLLAASALMGARGVVEVAARGDEPGFRLAAPFDPGEANTLGEYLMFTMALALGLLLTVRSAALRMLLAGLLALDGFAFLHTYSRGSYIGLVAAVLVAAVLRDPRLLIVVGVLAFVVPPHLPEGVTARLETIPREIETLDTSDGGSNALLARLDSYRVAAQRVGERPILGHGPGVVALARIESQYAREAIDGGLLGLAAFLWFLARTGRLGRQVLASARNHLDRGFGLGYLTGLVGMAVAALGAIPFTTIRTMEAFSFATGLAVVLWRIQRAEEGAEG